MHRAKIAHPECGWKDGDSGDPDQKKENLVNENKNQRTDLTPTGLLMEGDYTNYDLGLRRVRVNECNGDFATIDQFAISPFAA